MIRVSWIPRDQLETAASGTTRETRQRICQGLDSTDVQILSRGEAVCVLRVCVEYKWGTAKPPFPCSSLCEPHPGVAEMCPAVFPQLLTKRLIKWLLFSQRAHLMRNDVGRAFRGEMMWEGLFGSAKPSYLLSLSFFSLHLPHFPLTPRLKGDRRKHGGKAAPR